MRYTELIVDKAAFSSLKAECEKVVDIQKRLPNFVFSHPFGKYYAIEHAYLHKKAFGEFLCRLSSICEDKSVNYMTIEPDPVDYYYHHFRFFGLASFEPAKLIERYTSVMSQDGDVDSFQARGGDVGVFWGSSLRWGIFCDRVSWEMAVIAVADNVDVPTICGFRCMDASWLSDYIKSQYPHKPSIALEFIKAFLTNYKS